MPLRPYNVGVGSARTLPTGVSALEPRYVQLSPRELKGFSRAAVVIADPDSNSETWVSAIRSALADADSSGNRQDEIGHVTAALAPIGVDMADHSSALAVTLVYGKKDVFLFCLGSGEAHAVPDGERSGEVVYEEARHGLRVIRLSGVPDAGVVVIGKPGATDVTRTDVIQALEVGHSLNQTATWLSALGSARAGTACSCLTLTLRTPHRGVTWRPRQVSGWAAIALPAVVVIVVVIGLLLKTVFAASSPHVAPPVSTVPALSRPVNLGVQITPTNSVLHWSAVPGARAYSVAIGAARFRVTRPRLTVPPSVKAGVRVPWRVLALARGRRAGVSSPATLLLPAVVAGVATGNSSTCGTYAALPGKSVATVNLSAAATTPASWRGLVGVTCAWISSGNGSHTSVVGHGSPVYAFASWHLPGGNAFTSHQLGLRWLVYPGSPKNVAVLLPTPRALLRIHTAIPGIPVAGTHRLSTATSLGTLAPGNYALVVRARLFGSGCPSTGCSGAVRQLAFRVQ